MAWDLLFTSDIGLLSLLTIGFILVMAVYILRYVAQHAKADAKENLASGSSHGLTPSK
ncbi:DUF3149 domain-containing protein [Dechloromonas sp. A34]|uniref:DUF3149 domain-containing protein n=1 Tax=Dechloromonas sp. A34 TaxID=447588 RepID=UPI002248A1B7|nr:DUF3149 domain-containing protein [Dechloromonas sp. A34]